MGLNNEIIDRVKEKTEDDRTMRDFIVNILQKEGAGLGQYKKFYTDQIEKATKGVTE